MIEQFKDKSPDLSVIDASIVVSAWRYMYKHVNSTRSFCRSVSVLSAFLTPKKQAEESDAMCRNVRAVRDLHIIISSSFCMFQYR